MALNRKLIDILLDFHGNGRDGILRIEKGATKKQLALDEGRLAFAESNAPAEHLARVMISIGALAKGELREVASLMKKGVSSEAAILTLVKERQMLEKGRHEQAILIVASLLGWDDCDVRFYPGKKLIENQLSLQLALPDLILLSVRRAVSSRILPIPPDFPEAKLSMPTAAQPRSAEYPLREFESLALSRLSAGTTAAGMKTIDALSLIPENEGWSIEALYALCLLGLVQSQIDKPRDSSSSEASDALTRRLEEMLPIVASGDLYGILSLPVKATPEQIQSAYHDLARQLHPDRFQSDAYSPEVRSNAERVFTKINEAYLTLRSAASRSIYDANVATVRPLENRAESRTAKPEETAEALFADGRHALAHRDYAVAIDRLKAAVWLCPNKAAYNHFLGVAESEMPNSRKSAEQHLLKAIELDGVAVNSHLELAKLYIKVSLRRKAEFQLEQALRWDPGNREATGLLAELRKRER